jgi:hypothetical protein
MPPTAGKIGNMTLPSALGGGGLVALQALLLDPYTDHDGICELTDPTRTIHVW